MLLHYLLVKTHNETGLKYLCKYKGSLEGAFRYTGSGKYWKRHLKMHGNNCETTILLETDNEEELQQHGLFYSREWNIVENDEWANLIVESGRGGATFGFLNKKHSPEWKAAQSLKMLGIPKTETHKKKLSIVMQGRYSSPQTEFKKGQISWNKGKSLSKSTKRKISETRKQLGVAVGPNNPRWKGGVSQNYKRKLSNE
jgi:hypothetical protein